jgi:hypothetical protein
MIPKPWESQAENFSILLAKFIGHKKEFLSIRGGRGEE